MGRVQLYLWRTGLLFYLSGLVQWGEARVLVEVQSGPLYRVIGYPLSISCNVSGFSNPEAQQDFQFSIYRPEKPTLEVNIISTQDPDFAYAVYSRRISKNEITLERLLGTSVLFHVNSLGEGDEGEYECHTPNSEAIYDGTYNDKTIVKVIKDTLTTSYPGLASLSLSEGDTLTLQCQASSNTFQHTHLSVTWYLHGDGETLSRPIISLDKDLTLSPGLGFEGRYQAGLIGLDKVEEATYKLRMDQLELSDRGRIYCQSQEWIQDPDRSWYPIAQKSTNGAMLEVIAKEVAPDKGSMVVRMTVQKADLQEGEELSVRCSVDAQNLAGRFFSVAWVRADAGPGPELARIGPTGVLIVGPEYSGRESGGELRAVRTGDKEHLLTLRPVRTQDQGGYLCRAWPQDRNADGAFTQGPNQDSNIQSISISAIQSGLAVAMETTMLSVNEGDELRLTCRVSGVKGQLSVIWQHRLASTAPFSDVMSLSREGVMEVGAEFKQRSTRTLRTTADTFTMELSEVTPSDAGVYQCTVSEWTTETNGNIMKTHSQSQNCDVKVHPVESLLTVDLSSRKPQMAEGSVGELVCRVRGPHLPATVTWSLKRKGASSPDTILTLSHTGEITWGGDQGSYQMKAAVYQGVVHHILRINKASQREAGHYQCEISVFLQKTHRKRQPSNLLAVLVETPVSELSLSSSPSPLERSINSDIEMKCSVIKATSDSSRLAVTWLVEGEVGGNQTLLSSDRDAVVTLGAWAGFAAGQRISMRRREGRHFELTIRQAQIGDSGRYYCVVEEWLQDPHGQWYGLPPTSVAVELRLQEIVSDLTVDMASRDIAVKEGEGVELNCTLTSGASDLASLYTFTWYYVGHGPSSSSKVPLMMLGHDGVLKYPENQGLQDLQGRLRFSRPTRGTLRLGLERACQEDSGAFQCQVDQYKLNQQGNWELKASDESGITNLVVRPIVSELSLSSSPSPLERSINSDIEMKCSVIKVTSDSSRLAVTWLVQGEVGGNQTLLSSDRDAVVTLGAWARFAGQRISMRRREGRHFELTIRQAHIGDSGRYYCVVEEWLQDPHGQWYGLPPTSVAVELRLQEIVSDLTVDMASRDIAVKEGEGVELNCTLTSGASDLASLYTFTWYYVGHGPSSSSKVPLMMLGHDGVLKYPENQGLQDLQGRLRFSRPTRGTLRLGLQRACQEDNGAFHCQVDQYKLNQQGNWELKASDESGTTNLVVRPIENNLHVLKQDRNLNVSSSQAAFTVSCNITSRSSQSSEFQVTWFWRNETVGNNQHPIFRVHRDSTLQDMSGRNGRVMFGRPQPCLYILTVTMAMPADSGVYFCEVEEWLLSSLLSWRKVAEDKTGELTINIHTEGGDELLSVPGCSSGTVLGVLVPLLCILLTVILVLSLKMMKERDLAAKKKQADSLWAGSEANPLKALSE